MRASLRRVMATKQPHEMAPRGIYCDLTYPVSYNKAGQIDGFLTYPYDVTEQMYAQREREDQRLRLQRLFLEAPATICILSGPDLLLTYLGCRTGAAGL
ncbi:hypothetical protein F1C16_08975 [Hymenobacter sp. NBH84]|uniref:hypothetical protein n=1 Tax=Hymenobacter sp. NBH84 TaxID=2596915 RepID=UPI0016282758|nr:hypothetical protein [Hymenobacter sp. NBH84]QNE39676.1 hypothetical protein F1C16_08975 [Hymenobacter sp. NBH84]